MSTEERSVSRLQQVGPASGFVFRVERARGPQWYAKVARAGRPAGQAAHRPGVDEAGRPDPGYFTKRTAEDWLRSICWSSTRSRWPAPTST
jgi:hypothetical protein